MFQHEYDLYKCLFGKLFWTPNQIAKLTTCLTWKYKQITKLIKCEKETELLLEREENIVGKEENAGNQHFLLFPQCF